MEVQPYGVNIWRERMTGHVKWYNPQKGYGFADSPDGDVFLHRTRFKQKGELHQGETIQFKLEKGEKGPIATEIVAV
jgi:CspA family cold shock protein